MAATNRTQLDNVGRFVIPFEIRELRGYKPGVAVEFYFDGKTMVLRPLNRACVFCGDIEATDLVSTGLSVCPRCCWEAADTLTTVTG